MSKSAIFKFNSRRSKVKVTLAEQVVVPEQLSSFICLLLRSSVDGIQDMRTRDRWFDSGSVNYLAVIVDSSSDRKLSSPANDERLGKMIMRSILEKLQESMNSCTGRCNITEIMLKSMLNTT